MILASRVPAAAALPLEWSALQPAPSHHAADRNGTPLNEETSAATVEPGRKPWHGRLLEALGYRLMRWGLPVARLTEESLCRAARRRTRLQDFGDDDFWVPLRLLLDDFEADDGLGFVGRLAVRLTVVEGLVNRLRIQKALERHPEILDVPIRAPVFVIGMPRTGTTLLHNLLAQDPAGRAPRLWELDSPWPLDAPEPGRPDPRIEATRRRLAMLYRFSPASAAVIHEFRAEDPEECHHLFRNSMATQSFRAFADVPRFSRWKLEHDMLPEYRYYRRQLQMLLWQRPAGCLILKFPGHAWHLDALLQLFPDARIVCTHREMVKVVGSFCSMVAAVRFGVRRKVDPVELGRVLTSELETGLARMTASRERADPACFCDVRYDALTEDPVATVRDIYLHFDMPFPDETRHRMERWLAEHRQHRHGKHVYHLSRYGLDEQELRERFAAYAWRYGLSQATPD